MVREELDNQQFRRDFREISEQSHHAIPDIEYPFILGLQCLVILRNFNFHMTRHQTRNQKYDKKNILKENYFEELGSREVPTRIRQPQIFLWQI